MDKNYIKLLPFGRNFHALSIALETANLIFNDVIFKQFKSEMSKSKREISTDKIIQKYTHNKYYRIISLELMRGTARRAVNVWNRYVFNLNTPLKKMKKEDIVLPEMYGTYMSLTKQSFNLKIIGGKLFLCLSNIEPILMDVDILTTLVPQKTKMKKVYITSIKDELYFVYSDNILQNSKKKCEDDENEY